jgi:thymidylate synthase (FAD)
MDQVTGQTFPVLDHGFVRVVDVMGDDSSIVQAARVSYGAGTKKVSEDRALIWYLMRNEHMSPFEMCEIKLHVKLPLFVARQWLRHRTANVNEYSARYSVMGKDFYVPAEGDVSAQSKNNKQGRESELMECAEEVRGIIRASSEGAYATYEGLLEKGVAREIARIVLPVNFYTEFYWKIDLRNLLHFVKLRADEHAQLEIRRYADVIVDVVKAWVPATYDAFVRKTAL